MGDVGEVGKVMKQWAKERRESRLEANWRVLDECGIPFEERPAAVLFREPGCPKVDFYPGTGRWLVCGEKRANSSGAVAFLSWYRTRRRTDTPKGGA